MTTERVKPSLNKEDYDNLYEYRRQWLSAFEKDPEMDYYPKSYSFFCKQGKTPVTAKTTPLINKEVDYPVTMNIKEAFKKIEDVFVTKKLTKGRRTTLRASMDSLKPHEEYLLISLLTYLREAYMDAENEVLLSYQEFYLLKNGGFTKYKKK